MVGVFDGHSGAARLAVVSGQQEVGIVYQVAVAPKHTGAGVVMAYDRYNIRLREQAGMAGRNTWGRFSVFLWLHHKFSHRYRADTYYLAGPPNGDVGATQRTVPMCF